MSKIKKITVSNLKAISSMTADFQGCTAIITGGNNKGKSTFLRSLPDRLRGVKPDVVLKNNETDGSAELELTTGEKFIWTFDGKKEKLIFISERNIPQSVTKDLCKVYFPPVFDVDKFLNSTPKEQKKVLQGLTGIDFTEFDRMYQAAYEDRAFKNKRVAEEKTRLVLIDPDLPSEEIPLEEMEKEYNGIEAHNLRYDNVISGISAKKIQIGENVNRIAQLQMEIKALEDKNATLNEEVTRGDAWILEEKNKRKDNAEELAATITRMRAQNAEIRANNVAKEQNRKFNLLVEDAAQADAEVKRIEQERLDIIKNSSMPEGFAFTDDGITYNGFAFDKSQLSSSGIYIAALKLAALNLGEVKTLHFDASYLDKNSLSEIEEWANENDLQLLIERPDFEGGEIEYHILQK